MHHLHQLHPPTHLHPFAYLHPFAHLHHLLLYIHPTDSPLISSVFIMPPIVLCLDGTNGSFGSPPHSNVLKLYELLDPSCQTCYYQTGVGTSLPGQLPTFAPVGHLKRHWLSLWYTVDAALGYSLERHVIAAYVHLMQMYHSCGDKAPKIYIFGFSRGALAARVLAAMIDHVGLLRAQLEDLIPTAWSLYAGWEVAGQPIGSDREELLDRFKSMFSVNVKIHFLGLWDTVSLVGLMREWVFPYSQSTSLVSHVRHAVSLDERRCKYRPVLLVESELKVENVESTSGNSTSNGFFNFGPLLWKWWTSSWGRWWPRLRYPCSHQKCKACEDSVEMWFSGDHGDIGGGWPGLGSPELSDMSLYWMIQQAQTQGVMFRSERVKSLAKVAVCDCVMLCRHDYLALRGEKCVERGGREIPEQKERRESKAQNGGTGEIGKIGDIEEIEAVEVIASECVGLTSVSKNASITKREKKIKKEKTNTKRENTENKIRNGSALPDFSFLQNGYLLEAGILEFNEQSERPGFKANKGKSSTRENLAGEARIPIPPKRTKSGKAASSQQESLECGPNIPKGSNPAKIGVSKDQTKPQSTLLNPESTNSKTSHGLVTSNTCAEPTNQSYSIYSDTLPMSIFWWILEFLPFGTAVRSNGVWRTQWRPNYGHSRIIDSKAVLHWSVFLRMHCINTYRPNNLPFEIGPMVLELMKRMSLDAGTKEYVRSLTQDSIVESHPVWTKLQKRTLEEM